MQITTLPNEITTLARMVLSAGCRLYCVGGMVRNPLLGLPVSDMDVCSAVKPEAFTALMEGAGYKTVQKGAAFGMVEVHIGQMHIEHTTFRADEYAAGGAHRPQSVRYASTPGEDAFRRDFTVNALYYDPLAQTLLDPTGGLADIKNRLIRATSSDPRAIMRDDALRILRMVRFAGELGFDIAPETLEAARENASGLCDISAERIRGELDKILLCDVRYGNATGVLTALERLNALGALDIILPEVVAGRGVKQKAEFHAYDVMEHLFHTAACIEPVLELRLAALLHDVGKPVALASTGRMFSHDAIGERIAREVLERLRYPAALRDCVCELIRYHMYDLRTEAKEDTLRAWFAGHGVEFVRRLALIRRADVHGSGRITGAVESADRWDAILDKMLSEGAPFDESELDITGSDIMAGLGIPASPEVGRIKRGLLLHCAKHPKDNKKEKLLRIARDIVNNS